MSKSYPLIESCKNHVDFRQIAYYRDTRGLAVDGLYKQALKECEAAGGAKNFMNTSRLDEIKAERGWGF